MNWLRSERSASRPSDAAIRKGGATVAKKKVGPQFGKLPPQHRFFLNPYRDMRFTSCPKCNGKTKLRKLPLAIHVNPPALHCS